MKSVKNFFIERLQSIDHADIPSSGNIKNKDKNPDDASTTSGASISGEESPSNPTLVTETLNETPSADIANLYMTSNSPKITSPNDPLPDKTISCPFDFSTSTAPVNQKQKNRRKISLPWGRQSSIAKNLGLSRQHTIDTPSSFRIFRQSSNKIKVCEFKNRNVIT